MFLGLRKCQHSIAMSSGPSPHLGCGLAFKGCRMQWRVWRNQGEALAEGDPWGMVTACDSFAIMFHPLNHHLTHSLMQQRSHECKPKTAHALPLHPHPLFLCHVTTPTCWAGFTLRDEPEASIPGYRGAPKCLNSNLVCVVDRQLLTLGCVN